MTTVSLTVNGQSVTADVDPRTLLVQFLRDNLRLTGTHVGCDTSQCGACVVHLNGQAVKSCTILAVQANASVVTTIEGIAQGGELHPMQAAFREHHGLQCGYCTPGMIMSAIDIVNRKGSVLDEQTIRARARRQSVPLHGLSQHRQGRRRRRAGHGPGASAAGGGVERATRSSGTAPSRTGASCRRASKQAASLQSLLRGFRFASAPMRANEDKGGFHDRNRDRRTRPPERGSAFRHRPGTLRRRLQPTWPGLRVFPPLAACPRRDPVHRHGTGHDHAGRDRRLHGRRPRSRQDRRAHLRLDDPFQGRHAR